MSDNYQGGRNMPMSGGAAPVPVFVTDQDVDMEEKPATNLSNVADIGASSHEGGHATGHGPGSSVEVSASNCRTFDSNPLSPACSESSAGGEDVFMDVTEIEDAFKLPYTKLTVRLLRRILSIMMVIVYKTDCEIAQKRKMKGLWDKRPSDWPDCVPFKDPNNGVKLPSGRHGQKPKQNELLAMFKFLKQKYLNEVTRVQAGGGGATLATKEMKNIKEEPANDYVVQYSSLGNRYAVAPGQGRAAATPVSGTIPEAVSAGQSNASQPVEVRLPPLLEDQQRRLQQQMAQIRHTRPEAAQRIRFIEAFMDGLVQLAKRRPSSEINIALNQQSLDVEALLNRTLLSDPSFVTTEEFKKAYLVLHGNLVRCIAEFSQAVEVRRLESEVSPQIPLLIPHTTVRGVISMRGGPSEDPDDPDEKKEEETVQIDPDAFLNSQEKGQTKTDSTQEALDLPDPKYFTCSLKVDGETLPGFESEKFELEHVAGLVSELEETYGGPASLPLPCQAQELEQMLNQSAVTIPFNTSPPPPANLMSSTFQPQDPSFPQNMLQDEAMEMDIGEPSGAVSCLNAQDMDVWLGRPSQ